jgi:PAS domain S-box-containing protein
MFSAAVTPPDGAQRALAALGAIARALASEPASDALPGALTALHGALGSDECAIWVESARGLARASSVGTPTVSGDDVAAQLDHPEDAAASTLMVVKLAAGGRYVGALSASGPRPSTSIERELLSTVGDLLAAALVSADQLHKLQATVEQTSRQVTEQRRFIERVVDSLPHGLYVIDRQYRIQAWNRKRETGMQGVSREEALGRTIFEILHRQPADVLRREFDDVFSSGQVQHFYTESKLTGDLRTFRISKIPMRLDDATVTHVITIGEDVTESVQAQQRFAQTEKLAAVGTLAAGVMHEINNPLATIAACAESMQIKFEQYDPAAVAPYAEYLKLIDNEVHRCKRIVDGLLDFSRPKGAVKEPMDVNAVIRQTLFLLKHHTRFKQLSVTTDLDPAADGGVEGNPEQLIQVFMALLLNAMDAMNGGGRISIRTRPVAGGVAAEVADTGHGIARSEVTKIF